MKKIIKSVEFLINNKFYYILHSFQTWLDYITKFKSKIFLTLTVDPWV